MIPESLPNSGVLSERTLFQNSKCQRGKNVSCNPGGYSPIRVWFSHSTLELGYVFERKLLFQVKTRVRGGSRRSLS